MKKINISQSGDFILEKMQLSICLLLFMCLVNSSCSSDDSVKVDDTTVENPENKNNVKVSINIDGKALYTGDEDYFKGSVAASKSEDLEQIVITAEGEGKNITIGFSGIKTFSTRPITGIVNEENPPENSQTSAGVGISNVENLFGVGAMTIGNASITKLKEDEVIVEFSGTGLFVLENMEPEEVPIQGKIVCQYPTFALLGIDKNELFD